MSADGRVTEGDIITQDGYCKIRRLGDGRIVGFSGNAFNDEAFAAWLVHGGELPKGVSDDEFSCLVLYPDGSIKTYDSFGREFDEVAPYAIGSGRKFAFAAMDMGRSPADAVTYSIARDIYSGGVVATLFIDAELRAVA